ncbi:MAG TPA: glutathione S-transferase family protein [Solirubrobacteraceae bacterium]|jgi:glutathione S-transferase|nr:glutathione S-transferase family protein [Solirubrobacteraceae bacterium]
MLRLITIPISHYCEKARWGLQRAGLSYHEEPHVQGLHRLYARRAGGGVTVPVLVTPDGAIGESEQILEWVDERTEPSQRLFGTDAERERALALCRRLDARLGPHGRRLIYVRMFEQRELMLRYNDQGVPRWEDRALRIGLPVAKRFIGRLLEIRPGVEREDEAAVFAELDWVAEQLADGRPYLLGERFSAADLTFAALAAPIVLPPVYGVPLPPAELLDAPSKDLLERGRAHPAGAFALRLYDERAGAPAPA